MKDQTSTPDLRLAAAFPPAARADWLKLVDAVLKGRPFERLVAKSYDGLPIGPLYGRAADVAPIPGRAMATPWQAMARIDHPDPAAANAQVLQELENGAAGLVLVFAGAAGAYGFGLPYGRDTVSRVLEGVHLDAGVAIELDLPADAPDAARDLAALVRIRGVAPAATQFRFGLGPLGAAAWRDNASHFARLIADLAGAGFPGPFAVADGRSVHAACGSEAQELAFALAAALACLRALEAVGIELDAARKMIFFRLAADADEFLTIVKFRALRKLWARVEEACGVAPHPAFVSAETAWRMMTRRDPHVNLLRATMAVFSAAVGGADAIAVLPFTAALGLPDPFARRLARNTQLLLAEESSLAKVLDPASGAGAIEEMTVQLCAAAWTLFQEIEREGGAGEALAKGHLQQKVAAVRSKREQAVARRSDVLTGITEFPNLREALPAVLASAPVSDPAAGGGTAGLPRIRLAEPFEVLRDASDAALARNGARPRIFLATLGTAADFTARAAFVRSLFETGGIEAVGGDGYADIESLVAAFAASGAKLACLCASDALYGQEAAAAAGALKRAGAAHIYLAGRPGEHESGFRAAGVQDFVYAGCDALSTLRTAHDRLRAGMVGSS